MTDADARVAEKKPSGDGILTLFDEESAKVIWFIEGIFEDSDHIYSIKESQRFSTGSMKENTWYLEFVYEMGTCTFELHLEDSKALPVKVEVESNIVNHSQRRFCAVKRLRSTLDSHDDFLPLISTTEDEIRKACNISVHDDPNLELWCRIRHINTDDRVTALAYNLNQMQLYEHCLSEDLKLRMNDGKLSDVELVVEKQKFQSHKFILASRSPVFEAMFQSDMQENTLNTVNIPDVSLDVMHKVMSFIYTDKVEIDEDSVKDVMAAAEKYQILGLKSICTKFIMTRLNDGNVIESLILAGHYHAEDLQQESINSIVKNIKNLPKMEGFSALISCHPSLVEEIFVRMSNS